MNFLWQKIFLSIDKEIYSCKRMQGEDYHAFIEEVWTNNLKHLLPEKRLDIKDKNKIIAEEISPYHSILKQYKNTLLLFCLNSRQLSYFTPIIEKMQHDAVILTMEDISDAKIEALKIPVIVFGVLSQPIALEQDYLRNHFEYLFLLTNTFYLLIKDIMPSAVMVMEGCHYEAEVISSVSKILDIKTICVQQGWPGLMHTRFKNMTYDYFLSWGKGFNELWKKYSSGPAYLGVGYPFSISAHQSASKQNITFFFQAPLFTISNQTFQDMIAFAFYCSRTFPDRTIWIREHPEYNLNSVVKAFIGAQPNMGIVTERPLSEVYAETEIGVAIFSSTLMEGIIHHVIPFVFNLTSMPCYYPDVDKDGIGVEAKSMKDAQEKICRIINDPTYRATIKNKIEKAKRKYFQKAEGISIKNVLDAVSYSTI